MMKRPEREAEVNRAGRLLLKAQWIQRRLRGEPGSAHGFLDKPRGMHWSTYESHYAEYEAAELEGWAATALRFGHCKYR
jgi:hypothetical protein